MRNYKQGEVITSLDDLSKQEFIFFKRKLYHKGWFFSWQLRWVSYWLNAGQFFKAIKKELKND